MPAMLAQIADSAVLGGVVVIGVTLSKVVEHLIKKRFNGNGNGKTEIHDLTTFVSGPRGLLYEQQRQTEILSRLEGLMTQQTKILDKRVEVCESHTEILRDLEKRI